MSGAYPCRFCGERPVPVDVVVPARLSHTGEDRPAVKLIDRCIAGLVRVLNEHGIRTDSSCCGHGAICGSIDLNDGYVLTVRKREPVTVRAEDFQVDDDGPEYEPVGSCDECGVNVYEFDGHRTPDGWECDQCYFKRPGLYKEGRL